MVCAEKGTNLHSHIYTLNAVAMPHAEEKARAEAEAAAAAAAAAEEEAARSASVVTAESESEASAGQRWGRRGRGEGEEGDASHLRRTRRDASHLRRRRRRFSSLFDLPPCVMCLWTAEATRPDSAMKVDRPVTPAEQVVAAVMAREAEKRRCVTL